MAFQIVELTLDADDNVIERRVVPYPYQTREETVDTIESVISRFAASGYELKAIFGGPSLVRARPEYGSSLKAFSVELGHPKHRSIPQANSCETFPTTPLALDAEVA
jgi:hypothetical protein